MGCCDKKRAVLAPASRPRAQASRAGTRETRPGLPVSQPRTAAAAVTRVTVRYAGTKKIRVRGPATGSVYHCSASSRMLSVDVRDVAALLRTGQFTA